MPTAPTSTDLIAERLHNQQLIHSSRKDPAEVVAWLGAIQAQDFSAAKWAIGLRAPGCHDHAIEDAFNGGRLLRTHVLRPTWHLVAAADIRWMLALTAPRVHAANAYYYKRAELDARVLARSCAMMSRVLEGGQYKTRPELAVALKRAKVAADGLKLAYIVMHAELEGVITSGPRRGKQFTYALLEDRAPGARLLDRDEALAELARRYFSSHGPATVRDFSWWSGLTLSDAQRGIDAVTPTLQQETIDGRVYWAAAARASRAAKGCLALLLPTYDEYLIAYKERSPVIDSSRTAANLVARSNGAFPNHLVIDGRLEGSWRRTIRGNSVAIEVAPYDPLTPAQTRAVMNAVDCYGDFLGLPASLSVA